MNYFGGFSYLAWLGVVSFDAVSRGGQRAMKVVELIDIEPDRLLTAPSQSIRPRQIANRDSLRAIMLLECQLDFLVGLRRWQRVNRRIIA